MITKFLSFSLSLCLLAQILITPISAQSSILSEEGKGEILVNNRILLKINGKPITVVDVVKKMDILFYRQYPHLLISDAARYEFYMKNFHFVFSSLVNDFLVVADAEEKEVEITEGDVREEMETLFGPDVVSTIDRLGLVYDEAWDLIKRELLVRRMNQMMVRSKAMTEVQPKELKGRYEEYLKAHPPEKQWSYHIITARGLDRESTMQTAERAYAFLIGHSMALTQLSLALKEEFGIEISFSEEYVRTEKEISMSHKKALEVLVPLGFSRPIIQENKKEGGYTARLFFLKDCCEKAPLSFNKLEDQLQNELMQKAISHHGEMYSEKLRARYGITNEYLSQMIPNDFIPFAMR